KPLFAIGTNEEDKQRARDVVTKIFAYLSDSLYSHDFIIDDTFTIADCYLFVMVRWAKEKAGIELSPRLKQYYDPICERPSVRLALQEEGLAQSSASGLARDARDAAGSHTVSRP